MDGIIVNHRVPIRSIMSYIRSSLLVGGVIFGKFLYPSVALGFTRGSSDQEYLKQDLRIKLYQFYSCPFCCKVRAYMNYCKHQYESVEVNPIYKTELEFSEYKKVPVVIVDDIQVNDSSKIISLLESCALTKLPVADVAKMLEETEDKSVEDRYRLIGDSRPTQERTKEVKWRTWVNDYYVHTLAPNIYRTMNESYEAMEYISTHGNFSSMSRFFSKHFGAIAMYTIGKALRDRHHLGNDVRVALYEYSRIWLKTLEAKNFNGGDRPNLADIEAYGVLTAVEGLQTFDDLQKNVPELMIWYDRMKSIVQTGRKL